MVMMYFVNEAVYSILFDSTGFTCIAEMSRFFRFQSLLRELRIETFDQKPLLIYVIRLVKNSIVEENARIPNGES